MGKTRFVWVAVALAVASVAAIACGSSTTPTPVPTSSPTPVPTATVVPAVAAVQAGAPEAVTQDYVTVLRAMSERSDALAKEVFGPLENATGPAAALPLLAEGLPRAIEGAETDISELEALEVPDDYLVDHGRLVTFLRDQIELWRRQLEATETRDVLAFRALSVEEGTLRRNFVTRLSESFRELVLVSEEAQEAAEIFGGLSDEESAYLDTVTAGFEEFSKRVAVFGQVLSRQFADARTMLEALRGAGAGTAFEAVQEVIAPVQPPPRFEADHELLLRYLEGVVRLDREVGKAVEDGDPVHFVVSNFELGSTETSVRAMLDLSPQVRAIAFGQLAYALRPPGPDVLDGGYRESLYTTLREFRARFPRTGPDYLAFNLDREDAYQVVALSAPGFLATIENAQDNLAALTPPDELREDHDRLVKYFEETLAGQQAIIDSAAAGDLSGVRAGMGLTHSAFCQAAKGFSDAAKPVVHVQFGGDPENRDSPRECGPPPTP